jgi:glucosyl-3-phosphoglycerate synthase
LAAGKARGKDEAVRNAAGAIATFHHLEFDPLALVAAKRGRRVAVCVPARDEEATVGTVVEVVREGLVDEVGLVDELVVVDDGSLDATAAAAAAAGARVVASSSVCDAHGRPIGLGKGGALRRGLEETTGELVVFLDADVTNLAPHFVVGLVGPLLTDNETALVKAFYSRPFRGEANGGGRVTELLARPLIAELFPELVEVRQPLAGETALRRDALVGLELSEGYGVEIGLLLDVAARYGTGAIAQVDLGVRAHRNRPLDELVPQARAVLSAALSRAGLAVA